QQLNTKFRMRLLVLKPRRPHAPSESRLGGGAWDENAKLRASGKIGSKARRVRVVGDADSASGATIRKERGLGNPGKRIRRAGSKSSSASEADVNARR